MANDAWSARSIVGKVIGVSGIQAKLVVATEAGVKTVILPAENEQDVRFLPDHAGQGRDSLRE
jgi:ATP-dependent Lon protease